MKVTQSCPTLCVPMDYRNSLGQNTGGGKPFPSPGDLHNPGIKPRSPTLEAGSLSAETQGKPTRAEEAIKEKFQCRRWKDVSAPLGAEISTLSQ